MEKASLWQYLCEFIVHGKGRDIADPFLQSHDTLLVADILNERNTLLHIAAMAGSADMVAALLEAGASPLIRNNSGQMPMELAHNEKVRELLKVAMNTRLWVDNIKSDGSSLSK